MRVPAWQGNWKARLAERLAARGFSTISAFADSQPRASRHAIADELSNSFFDVGGTKPSRDLAPVQILWALLDEARTTNTVEYRARDLLARDIDADLPEGWPPPDPPEAGEALIGALVNWSGGIVTHLTEYESTVNAVEDGLLAAQDIPVGWLPTSADDQLLVDLFRRYWREPTSNDAPRKVR